MTIRPVEHCLTQLLSGGVQVRVAELQTERDAAVEESNQTDGRMAELESQAAQVPT